MVCLGNICRSPMAEGVMRHLADKKGLQIQVDSAGTSNYHIGETPDSRAIQAMKQYGINISNLKARQFTVDDFDRFDVIYVMDEQNLKDAKKLAVHPEHHEKLQLLMDTLYPGKSVNVPDPRFGGNEGFHEVYQMLETAMAKIVDHLALIHTSKS